MFKLKKWLSVILALCMAFGLLPITAAAWQDVTDTIDRAFTGIADGGDYGSWSETGSSGAVYAGISGGHKNAIQLKHSDDSGIITAVSCGKVKKIEVEWNDTTLENRALFIYGKSEAYSSTSDLYDADKKGEYLGAIYYPSDTEMVITGDYEYIGILAKVPGTYLDKIRITWEKGPYDITVNEDAYLSVKVGGAEVTEAQRGDEVVLSAKPGYILQSLTVDGSAVEISNNSYSFTMPYHDVEVSAVTPPDPAHFSYNDKEYYFTIHSDLGWEVFCDFLSSPAYSSSRGMSVYLGADINVTRMAGDPSHIFGGRFDGRGHTMNVNIQSEAGNPYTAPFCCFGSTDYDNFLSNLSVTGSVYSTSEYAGGLVGGCFRRVYIKNCLVDVKLTNSGTGCCGGIAGTANYFLDVQGCMFTGKLIGGGTSQYGGFVGGSGSEDTAISVKDSVYAPASMGGSETEPEENCCTFVNGSGGTYIDNCFYERPLGTEQGALASEGPEVDIGTPAGDKYFDVSGIYTFYNGLVLIENGGAKLIVDGSKWTEITENVSTPVLWANSFYYVSQDVEISGRISVDGRVDLLLKDGCTLNAPQGISVRDARGLTICAQSAGENAGTLTINSVARNSAGIGGESENSCGTVNVLGGNITVRGGSYGAGIGGGNSGAGGTVNVYGGSVTVAGGYQGAGIGGGKNGDGGTVNVYGGSVTATGGVDGAGIGGGKEGSGGEITISGGSVTAKGGAKSAGIGGGCSGYNELIAISGGTVTAAGGNGGAGIGSAYDLSGEIKISGGCITAVSSANSAVIGGASWIEISGGQVTAVNESDSSAPAIGGDYENVELGLTNPTDFIKDKSGKGYAGTVTIADGKVLGDPEADRAFGEGEVDDISLLTGLTLRPAYTVVFSANDGSDSPAETTLVFPIGSPWALPTNVFSREGYALTGWNTQADGNGVGYSAGEPVTDLSADTLYAVWEEGAPVMSFVEVALRPKDTADEKKDLRFVFEITLNSTKLEVGSEWYGSGSAMYELTDISVRYKKGIEGTWSTTPMPIRNLFSVTNTDLTFTVVFVNLTDPGSKCYLAANYAYGLIGETAEFHQGVAVGACIDDIGNGNGIEHPDFPAEP